MCKYCLSILTQTRPARVVPLPAVTHRRKSIRLTMSRYLANRRGQLGAGRPISYMDDEDDAGAGGGSIKLMRPNRNVPETSEDNAGQRSVKLMLPNREVSETSEADAGEGSLKLTPSNSNVSENQEPFMGIKMRRKASLHRDYRGDYVDIPSRPYLMKILEKQGDKKVLFADKVLKFTASGKIKKRILIITDFAIYIVDLDTDVLKRRIALAAVEKTSLSELSDNFFAINIPTEYDLLMASARKTEIVTVLAEATKSASDYELEVLFSNSFEYHAAADLVKEVQFEEVEGGVKTRIVRK